MHHRTLVHTFFPFAFKVRTPVFKRRAFWGCRWARGVSTTRRIAPSSRLTAAARMTKFDTCAYGSAPDAGERILVARRVPRDWADIVGQHSRLFSHTPPFFASVAATPTPAASRGLSPASAKPTQRLCKRGAPRQLSPYGSHLRLTRVCALLVPQLQAVLRYMSQAAPVVSVTQGSCT